MASALSLPFLFRLASFSVAFVAAFSVLPLLFSAPTDSLLRPHRGMPLLFLLLNLLIAALYVTSTMMPRAERLQQEDAATILTMNEQSDLAQLPEMTTGDAVLDTATVCDPLSGGDMSRVEKLETTARHRARRQQLARSKSDGMLSLAAVGKSPTKLRVIPPLLKKARTFELAWQRRRPKPVVVVADPPEDGEDTEEEVDKKAEEFIGRFYQKVKLQRLESLKEAARSF